jgi:hypothetical protein
MLFTGKTRLLLLLLSKEGAKKEFTYSGEYIQLDFVQPEAGGTVYHYNQEQNVEPESIHLL